MARAEEGQCVIVAFFRGRLGNSEAMLAFSR